MLVTLLALILIAMTTPEVSKSFFVLLVYAAAVAVTLVSC